MTPLALKLPAPRSRLLTRTAAAVRQTLSTLSGAGLLDPVREPPGLQYPMGERARRLMRSGRIGGW